MALNTDQLAQALLNELNLDDAELATLKAKAAEAEVIVRRSIDFSDESDTGFSGAVKVMATQLYYDRTLSTGLSNGMIMMLTQLRAHSGTTGDGDHSGNV
ncbi:hypothetical protein [Lacticaseibacillus pantheris]|uniref:hypothetical protein n=1 Tax=Lacticaseibacillus pantheris TaxID=171523 RepID=UPI0026598EE4|nr:hypothetical protein [Lacticaseibacillus pantheris]WKF86020.1 hypothetical protein QY874_05420 [Lacticaseibacillus pantheris]